jgi:RecA/RadA recombinase
MDENRKKALTAALSQIEKQFGKGSVMRLGDAPAIWDIEAVPTGSLGLDSPLGSAACRADGLSRSTGRSPPARPHSRSRW